MNHKFLALLLGVITAGAVSTRAQTATTSTPATTSPVAATAPAVPVAPAAPSLAVTFTPSYVSTYMFRGDRLGGQSIQPSLEADYGNWALGVWASEPTDPTEKNKVPGQSDPEIDPYGSYTYNINDSLSIQPGFTWYTYTKAPTDEGFFRMSFEPNLAVNYTVSGVKFTPKFYYDVVLDQATYEFNISYAIPLKDLGTEVDLLGTAGTYLGTNEVNDTVGANTKAWGNYWLLGFSMPYQLTHSLKLSAGWAYTAGNDAYSKNGFEPKVKNTAAIGRGVATVSLAWTF